MEYSFFKVGVSVATVGTLRPQVNDIISVFFFCQDEEVFIERKVTTLIDILVTAGGFSSIIFLIARVFSLTFAKPLA